MACWVAPAVTHHHFHWKAEAFHLPFSARNAALLSPLRGSIVRANPIVQNRLGLTHQAKYVSSLTYALNNALGSQVQSEEGVDDEVCELVSGIELVLGEEEDSFNAYLLKAVKNNNGSAVLLLSDVYGYEDSATRDFAYRLSCNGYNAFGWKAFPYSIVRGALAFGPALGIYEAAKCKIMQTGVLDDISSSIAAGGLGTGTGGVIYGGFPWTMPNSTKVYAEKFQQFRREVPKNFIKYAAIGGLYFGLESIVLSKYFPNKEE